MRVYKSEMNLPAQMAAKGGGGGSDWKAMEADGSMGR